jgi:hypothetical protein
LTPPTGESHALQPGPYPPDLSRWNSYGCFTTDFSRAPSRLACRTRTIWQYRYVPALSRLLPAIPGVSRTRLPSASIRPLRRPNGEVLSPPHGCMMLRGARFPRSTHTRHDRGGRLLYPEARGVHTTGDGSPAAACRLHQRPGPTTRVPIPSSQAHDHEASSEVHSRSPVRSSPRPVAPPDGTGALRLLPRAPHPQQTGPTRRTSKRGPISNTDQELRTRHTRSPICAFTRHARPRVAPHR